MGVWGQMPDGTAIHIDFAVKKNCWNMEASCYGNCYGCGCCAKDKKQRYENRIRYLNGMIEEQEKFDNWFDEPEMSKGGNGSNERNNSACLARRNHFVFLRWSSDYSAHGSWGLKS